MSLSEERLALLRMEVYADAVGSEKELLAHVDHLTAEHARLRERLGSVRDYAEYRRLYSGVCRDILDLLNPPTEGETSE